MVRAIVEDNAIGRYDIVFGRKIRKEMKILLNFSTATIIWDDLSIPMKSSLKSKIEGLNSIDPADTHLPEFMQKAASRVVSSMHANTYDKQDYTKIIDRYAHLNSEQK